MRSAAHVQRAASSALPLVRATVPSVCAHHVPPPRSMATRSDSLPPPFTPARTALIFPGQGAQRVGSVVKTLEAEWPSIVRPVWQELDEALQMHLSRTMKDGLMSELSSTELAQPAILAHSYALWRVLSSTLGLKDASSLAQVALGHSLGEYTALVVAGSLSFANGARLVHARGNAMKYACAPGRGSMAALLAEAGVPFEVSRLASLLREAESATEEPVDLANLNSPYQVVISGGTRAVEWVKRRVNARGEAAENDLLTRGILRAVSLEVSGAFHSRLMSPASSTLAARLEETRFGVPCVPIVFNVHARPSVRSERFGSYLLAQLTAPVRWHASLEHVLRVRQANELVELGPSAPLTAIIRSTAKRLASQPTRDPFEEERREALRSKETTTPPEDRADIDPHAPPPPPPTRRELEEAALAEARAHEAELAAVATAWQGVCAAGVATPEDMHTLLRQQTQPRRDAV